MRQLYRALSNIRGHDLGSEPIRRCGLISLLATTAMVPSSVSIVDTLEK
jgi:hypothetical protein